MLSYIHAKFDSLRSAIQRGDLLTGDSGGQLVRLGKGAANQVLAMDATGDDVEWATVAGGGVTDHGALTGLSDDDHTQYHNDSRALTWLGTRSTSDVAEGTNLYYTNARVDARIVAADLSSTVRVSITGAQVIADSTLTAIAFNTETFDADGLHDNATNNTRLTAAVAGKYFVVGGVQYDTHATGFRILLIRKNGSARYSRIQAPGTAVAGIEFSTAAIVDLAVGDYVEFIVFQNSGGNLSIGVDANGRAITFGAMAYLGE